MKPVTFAQWRALVEQELAGVPFDKALVHATAEGIALQPLYTEESAAANAGVPGAAPFVRGGSAEARPFGVCMRVDPPDVRRPGALAEDIEGGADALWFRSDDDEAYAAARAAGLAMVWEPLPPPTPSDIAEFEARYRKADSQVGGNDDEGDEGDGDTPHWFGFDYIDAVARGTHEPMYADPEMLRSLGPMADDLGRGNTRPVRVSGVTYHDAGADAADELALMLSASVAYLRALTEGGIAIERAAGMLWFQVAIGRDTFGELCKLRALRLVMHKLFAASGAPGVPIDAIHAVCSSRTITERDPWVNLLRVTTQVFAAALGGAQLITPLPFDAALGPASAHARRVARNTALVLREESHLGRVLDPAGGSYYLEARTDALAREAWSRFTQIERDGGIVRALTTGALRERLGAAWAKRAAAIARRKEPVLGVSEFANLGEQLPAPVPSSPAPAPAAAPALVTHRDGEGFEAVRARVEAQSEASPVGRRTQPAPPVGHGAPTVEHGQSSRGKDVAPREVVLVTLGPPAEHRARVGYATALFATAGLRTREIAAPARADIACICGSDERYAAEAAACAKALRAAGCRRVVLAGRPGPIEAALREAGVDTFIFVGCDALATLTDLVGASP